MAKGSSRRNTRAKARRVTKRRTTTKGKKGTRVTRRTRKGKQQRTSSRNRRAVRFARFESSGKNNRFRPTKAEIELPPKIADYRSSGYGDLLLAPPCCGYMKSYQDALVGLSRSERMFYLTHKLPPADFGYVELFAPSPSARQEQGVPRFTAFAPTTQGRRQGFEVRVPPPSRWRSDLYNELGQERYKVHGDANRVSDYHRNECAVLDGEDVMVEEPLVSRPFVNPNLVRHCPDCKKNANWCDCPVCSNFI